MKILQIVTQMEAGGAQKVAHLLHCGFRAQGEDSELLFLYTKRPFYQGFEGVSSLLPHPPSVAGYLQITNRLNRKLRKARPDVLITHTHYANLMGQVLAAAAGVRQRIAVHHNPLPTYPAVARVVDRILGRFGAYSHMVVVSDAVLRTLEPYPAGYTRRVTRIYNGVAFSQSTSTDVRAASHIPSNVALLVTVGRLSRQKNHVTLLKALKEVPDAYLAIIGDGELSEDLQRQSESLQISDRVRFTGEIPSEDVSSWMRAADLFVFPSLWESMGIAVLEAMHAGLPVIASDIPAMQEVLGNAGLLVPAENSSALARAITRVLSDPGFASNLRSAGAGRVKLFSVEKMFVQYQKLIFG